MVTNAGLNVTEDLEVGPSTQCTVSDRGRLTHTCLPSMSVPHLTL